MKRIIKLQIKAVLIFYLINTNVNLYAQLYIEGNALHFSENAVFSTDVSTIISDSDITGSGKLVCLGDNGQQSINFGNKTVPQLVVNNADNIVISTNEMGVKDSLIFESGKILLTNKSFYFEENAVSNGHNNTKFIETNGTGFVRKNKVTNFVLFNFPIGENNHYRPVSSWNVGCSFEPTNSIAVKSNNLALVNLPPRVHSYLNCNWQFETVGISRNGTGTISLLGTYLDADIVGTETLIALYETDKNLLDWNLTAGFTNVGQNLLSWDVTQDTGYISGINNFIYVGAKAFLQGAYSTSTGIMSDNLRSLPLGTPTSQSNFPNSDPYRVSPYSVSFSHINNSILETINSSVLANQSNSNNDIVDWVYLELRNNVASPGNTILATRSALIQRDGDIVDVDGVSPVIFNEFSNNKIVCVRHRNHLGLSLDISNSRIFTSKKSLAFSAPYLVDFRTATDAQLYGPSNAFTTASHPTLGTVNLLWGGNANMNTNTRFTGLNNDKDYLLINTLGNSTSNPILNTYHQSDINMNKNVRFTGLNNDKDFLLINVLGNSTSTTRTQFLPN